LGGWEVPDPPFRCPLNGHAKIFNELCLNPRDFSLDSLHELTNMYQVTGSWSRLVSDIQHLCVEAIDHNADRKIDFGASRYSLPQSAQPDDDGAMIESKFETTHYMPCELLADVSPDKSLRVVDNLTDHIVALEGFLLSGHCIKYLAFGPILYASCLLTSESSACWLESERGRRIGE
jgi:hypothetical protein